jgi:hypothetical protein
MRGHPRFNHDAFEAATNLLRTYGFDIVSPAEMDVEEGLNPDDPMSWNGDLHSCMMRDVEAIQDVEAIILLPGWKESRGACFETSVAWYLGKKIYQYAPFDERRITPVKALEPRVSIPIVPEDTEI